MIDSDTANLLNQLQNFSIQSAYSGQVSSSVSTPSQPLAINVVPTSNPKGNQQIDGKKKR